MKYLRTATIFNLNNFLQLKPASARLISALVLFFAAAVNAQTNGLSDAENQGRELARQICDARPVASLTNTGVLQIHGAKGERMDIPIKIQINLSDIGWKSRYIATLTNDAVTEDWLEFIHSKNNLVSNKNPFLFLYDRVLSFTNGWHTGLLDEPTKSFANSDFWLCDLGLEFFYWPEQKILPKPTNLVRGREYTLLESTNPSTNGYSRVLSWIDKETGGILQAEAYDANGKLLKEFAPKSFKKVNGQWELQEMEIRNVQTGSRTRLEFDLNKQ